MAQERSLVPAAFAGERHGTVQIVPSPQPFLLGRGMAQERSLAPAAFAGERVRVRGKLFTNNIGKI
jgi:hypothetical protein